MASSGPLRAALLLAAFLRCGANTNFVLQRYQDALCTVPQTGQGTQQSWQRIGGEHSSCYHIMSGFACEFQCYVRMRCEYGTGSGVLLEDLQDDTCKGTPLSTRNLATHWTWLQAKSFFEGGCVQQDASTWLKFGKSLGNKGGYPNCEAQGNVATGGTVNAYQAEHTLQFYTDDQCTTVYEPSTFSTESSSKFTWKVHRGSEYCFDWEDITPQTPGVVSRWVPQSIFNFKLVCGNTDMSGNGIRVQKYAGNVCTGRAEAAEDWRAVFIAMNFPEVSRFFQGECVRWHVHYVKFDRPLEKAHYPDCADHACSSGYCAGGRIVQNSWSAYTGPIGTQRLSTSGAAALRACWPLMAAAALALS